jgi:origin recognition complex subunit 6
MSKAGVEQALTGLIPTLNGPLPPELVELALSLLARSRSVAHSLKVDEEIARPYACSQLACERYVYSSSLRLLSPH